MKATCFHLSRIKALLFLLIAAVVIVTPFGVHAHEEKKLIRIGWFESPFNQTDELGRKSGYSYDYQQKIAAFTGWDYEYVDRSWSDLLEMLVDGRIDILSDVSYTEERAKKMLFSSLPMGVEEYYIFIDSRNEDISSDDYRTFNGKKVGVNKGSIQAGYYLEWAEANGIQTEMIELTCPKEESLSMLRRGDIDMLVAIDNFKGDYSLAVPVSKIGSSEFFFAVNKSHPELLTELNAAMNRIQNENPYYNLQLNEKYFLASGSNQYLDTEENNWLGEHGPIRVGYQDNYLAFCARDEKTGELTGALKDYLEAASVCLENAHPEFEASAYPTAEAAIEAMKKGDVDCVFPVNLTDYDGEMQGLLITPPLMDTDMSAVIRESDRDSFADKERIVVAVNAGNPNYDMFLMDHFPDWQPLYYKDTPECLKAIADGQADCLLISNYRYNNISSLCRQYHLTTISTGVEMEYYFAVNRGETILYSILSKITGVVPESTVNAALSYYYTEDAKITFDEMLKENAWLIVVVAGAAAALFIIILTRYLKSARKVREEQMLISAAGTDELTGLYNKSIFYAFADRMHSEYPERQMDAIVIDIEQFHSVKAAGGQFFGDQVLRALGDEIHAFLAENEGIAGRAEADHFALYCPHIADCSMLLERLQTRMDLMSSNASIYLRMGVMPWQKDMDVHQQFEHALDACNMAQGNYKEHLIIVDEMMLQRKSYEQRMVNEMNRALKEGEFEIHYQPKYYIQCDTPRLNSAEALVRWRHPELGLIPPGDFITLFENSGRIGELDRYVWAKAARQIAVWKEKYGMSIPVSVNLSRVDVYDPALGKVLDSLLEDNGLEHGELKLEVTESACTDNPGQVIDVIERLRKKGYEIEMDDFGTGYSSLNMLSDMPIDVLKMDRAFISNIEYSKKDLQLVELIIDIAKILKVRVIAEGVETEKQLKLLKDMGCDIAQGFYFSPALSPEEFEPLLKQR